MPYNAELALSPSHKNWKALLDAGEQSMIIATSTTDAVISRRTGTLTFHTEQIVLQSQAHP